jgi:hypothetical protein
MKAIFYSHYPLVRVNNEFVPQLIWLRSRTFVKRTPRKILKISWEVIWACLPQDSGLRDLLALGYRTIWSTVSSKRNIIPFFSPLVSGSSAVNKFKGDRVNGFYFRLWL